MHKNPKIADKPHSLKELTQAKDINIDWIFATLNTHTLLSGASLFPDTMIVEQQDTECTSCLISPQRIWKKWPLFILAQYIHKCVQVVHEFRDMDWISSDQPKLFSVDNVKAKKNLLDNAARLDHSRTQFIRLCKTAT